MKIGELSKRTNTSKETIHHYIREGLLRKPHKIKGNLSNYSEGHVEALCMIKELREHYYLPLPEIKQYLKQAKKKSASDTSILEIHKLMNQFLKHVERLFPAKVVGREAFCRATGLERDFLARLEEWRVIVPETAGDDDPLYTTQNVIIGRLIGEYDRLGFGEKDGTDPEDIKRVVDFFQNVFFRRQQEILAAKYGQGAFTAEQLIQVSRCGDISPLLIVYLFRRIDTEGFVKFLSSLSNKQ